MTEYDPTTGPNLDEWGELDEEEQLDQVLEYHRATRVELPNPLLHAAIHVTVENQIAYGAELPVTATLARLMQEGLSRHDAVHAIGTVLVSHMQDLVQGATPTAADPNAPYYEQLQTLTAKRWRDETR